MNLVGLLTYASSNRGCLPKALPPQWLVFALVLRAYSGGGRAGFSPVSQKHQAVQVIDGVLRKVKERDDRVVSHLRRTKKHADRQQPLDLLPSVKGLQFLMLSALDLRSEPLSNRVWKTQAADATRTRDGGISD